MTSQAPPITAIARLWANRSDVELLRFDGQMTMIADGLTDAWRIFGRLDGRTAYVDINARTLMACQAQGDEAICDYVCAQLDQLALRLRRPPPVFRIGTRHHPKRLVARAA